MPLVLSAAVISASPSPRSWAALTPEEPVAAPAAKEPVPFAWPKLRISPAAAVADQSFETWYAAEQARLAEAVAKADSLIRRAEAHCAAANHTLAYGLSIAATCRVLQVPTESSAACASSPIPVLDAADEHLRAAGEALSSDAAKQGLVEADSAQREMLRHRSDSLTAFSAALRYALSPNADVEARRAAASRLSSLRESDDAATAAAASFWQALIRSMDEDKGPAESILGNPAAAVRPGTLPYAFFGKLLRTRMISAEGSPAAAMASLFHIEERTAEWFETQGDEPARNACRLLRLQAVRQWQEGLSDPARELERQWCKDRIEELLLDLSGEPEIAALSPVIPILATGDGGQPEVKTDAGEEVPADENRPPE